MLVSINSQDPATPVPIFNAFYLDFGAAYGTAKAGYGICLVGIRKPELVYKSLIPVIMAGILGIYGLIVCVILKGAIIAGSYSANLGFKHLASGLCVGLSSLAAGLAIGLVGDVGVRCNAHRDIFVGVILILIFAEALGLYGLIVSIILSQG